MYCALCVLEKVFVVLLFLLAIKTMTGFRWPWEICACCNKKMRDHDKAI